MCPRVAAGTLGLNELIFDTQIALVLLFVFPEKNEVSTDLCFLFVLFLRWISSKSSVKIVARSLGRAPLTY